MVSTALTMLKLHKRMISRESITYQNHIW